MFEQQIVKFNEELNTRMFAIQIAAGMDIPENRENTVEYLLDDAEKIYQWLTKDESK